MILAPPELQLKPGEALLLTGSHARGEADSWSDVDFWVLGPEKLPPRTFYSGDRLFVVSYLTAGGLEEEIKAPGSAPFVVPAIRQAQVIVDPLGEGLAIKAKADEWDWSVVEPLIPDWLGDHLLGMIEDAHKVRGAIANADWNRGYDPLQVLIFGCAEAMIVGLRLLPDTQNKIFSLVSATKGTGHHWSVALGRATGIAGPAEFADSLGAGLVLYRETAQELMPQLPVASSKVVQEAIERLS